MAKCIEAASVEVQSPAWETGILVGTSHVPMNDKTGGWLNRKQRGELRTLQEAFLPPADLRHPNTPEE